MKAVAKFSEGQQLTLIATSNVAHKALIGKKATIQQVVTFGMSEAMYWIKVGRTTAQVPESWLK